MRVRSSAFLVLLLLALVAPLGAQESKSLFDAAQIVIGPNDPQFDRILDYDGDGTMDAIGFVEGNGGGALSLYHNAGNGVFTSFWTFPGHPTPPAGSPIRIADLDGDGRDDFVVALNYEIHAWRSSGGQLPPVALPILSSNSYPILNMRLADLNGDGNTDILTVAPDGTSGQPTLSCYLMDATWQPLATTTLTLAPGAGQFVVARLGDGSHELFLPAIGQTIARLRVATDGTTITTLPSFTPGLIPNHLMTGDVDNDGTQDLVVFSSSGNQCSFLGSAGGGYTQTPLALGGPATELADVDGDGDLDGICCGGGTGGPGGPPPNNAYSDFEIAINEGGGIFAPSFRIRGYGAGHIAGASDLDGDGDVDLIAGRAIYFANGPLGQDRAPRVLVPGINPILEWTWPQMDFDGDGDGDLDLRLSGMAENDGSGHFRHLSFDIENPVTYVTNSTGASGDWDGDGDVDLVLRGWPTPGTVGYRLLRNLGGGKWRWDGDALPPGLATTPRVFQGLARAVDLDGDGDLDCIGTTEFPIGISAGTDATAIAWNDGTGYFPSVTTFNETVKGTGDFNGDGLTDLVVAIDGLWAGWRRNLGGGNFAPMTAFVGTFGVDSYNDRYAVADLDGDGDLDIALTGNLRTPTILENLGGGFQVRTTLPAITPANTAVRIDAEDLNGDGMADLVVFPAPDASHGTAFFLGNGPFSYDPALIQSIATSIQHDFDGDGDRDFFDRNLNIVQRSRRFDGVNTGARLQYGVGSPGTDGITPLLGASGPFRPGSLVKVHLRGGLGASNGLMAFSLAAQEMPDYPFVGTNLYFDPFDPSTLVLPFPLDGTPGVGGTGSFELPVVIPPFVSGFEVIHQAAIFDPGAPFGLSFTQALNLRYGL